MSIPPPFPDNRPVHADFAITAPRRHDVIGSALHNAFARQDMNDIPDDMLSLLTQIGQQSGQQDASG